MKAGGLSQVLLDPSGTDGSPGHQPGGREWPGSALLLGQIYKPTPKRWPGLGGCGEGSGGFKSRREKGVSLLPPASALDGPAQLYTSAPAAPRPLALCLLPRSLLAGDPAR